MVKELSNINKETFMMENGIKEKRMVKEDIVVQMEIVI